MFYKIQNLKVRLQAYLKNRTENLKEEAANMKTIQEAYHAGYYRGFWEGAGNATNLLSKEKANA